MKKPELLAPANNLEVLKVAIHYGADAVYIGGSQFSLRSGAKNANPEELREGIAYAHQHQAKVYVAVNIFAHERDLEEAADYLSYLETIRPDGMIMSDPGLIYLAKKLAPSVPIHLSTQANNCNSGTFNFWYEQGIRRVVTARELSLAEIQAIREKIPSDMEIECFIHGAMCISYSGRCLLSSFMTGRDANQGACTHPCRWKYAVVEEKRPGEYMPVEEDDRGTYIFHSKDLCMIDHIPELCEAGIASLKIEGRMKTALYVASVVRAYRRAIDDFFASRETYLANVARYLEEVTHCTYRAFTTGFYFGKPNEDAQVYTGNTYATGATYIGYVTAKDHRTIHFMQKNKFSVGEELTVMDPAGNDYPVKVLDIENEAREKREAASHASEMLRVTVDGEVPVGSILYIQREKIV